MIITRQDAAAARAANTRAAADRPRQRRNAEPAQSPPRVVVRANMQLRAAAEGSDLLRFTGYASVTETPYEMWDFFGPYDEIVRAGAFAKTLAQADLDVPLVLGHDQMQRLARTTLGTLRLSEDDTGLLVDADLDPNNHYVQLIAPMLPQAASEPGLIDEMSFAFRINAGQWSPDWMQFYIEEVDIHRGDVSIVGFGANPATSAALRSQLCAALERLRSPLPELLRPLI